MSDATSRLSSGPCRECGTDRVLIDGYCASCIPPVKFEYSSALSDLFHAGSAPDSESGGLDSLVAAAHYAHDVYGEIDYLADHAPSGPARDLLRVARQQAWDTWQRMERAGLPLLQEWQRDNGLAPASASDAADSTPRDGEQLGPLVYEAGRAIWRYSATYSERALAERRADSLQAAFVGVHFGVALYDGEWTAACVGSYTPQLRAAAR